MKEIGDHRELFLVVTGADLVHRVVHAGVEPHLAHAPVANALTAGFQRALLVGSIFILAAAAIALRATNTRGESTNTAAGRAPEPAVAG